MRIQFFFFHSNIIVQMENESQGSWKIKIDVKFEKKTSSYVHGLGVKLFRTFSFWST